MREFETGATRDSDEGKHDYEGFISPRVLVEYGRYMTRHRKQSDGKLRASDNWQKGIPRSQYVKSLLRHTVDTWLCHRGLEHAAVSDDQLENLCAVMFNVMGYLHEELKERDGVE